MGKRSKKSTESKKKKVWGGPPVLWRGTWIMRGMDIPDDSEFKEFVKKVYGLEYNKNLMEV